MFQFGGFAPAKSRCRALARRVAPFGNPRIKGRSRLPAEYRRLPRPSSPPGATGIPRAPSLACRCQRLRANGSITEPPTLARRVSSRYSITLFVVCRRDPRTTGRSPDPAQRAATLLPSILSMNPHRVHGGKSGE